MRLLSVAWAISLLHTKAWAIPVENEPQAEACQCSAVDYADTGSYLINADTNGKFSYASRFTGDCGNADVTSVVRSPDGQEYHCSTVKPGTPGSIRISECDVNYSEMQSGSWQILISLPSNATISRTFTLTVAAPTVVVATITPTVIVVTTSTPSAITVFSTVWETSATTLATPLITAACTPAKTQTSIVRGPPTTIVEVDLIVEVIVDGTVNATTVTTSTLTPSCRYPATTLSTPRQTSPASTARTTTTPSTARSTTTVQRTTTTVIRTSSSTPSNKPSTTVLTVPAPVTSAPRAGGYTFTMSGSTCSINFASIAGAGAGPPAWIISQWKGGPPPLLTAAAGGGVYSGLYGCRGPAVATTTRRVRRGDTGETGAGMGAAVKRAWTSTYVQTTYTETVVSTKVLEGETVTRRVLETSVQTVTPVTSTVCIAVPDVISVVTEPGSTVTQLTEIISTSHVTETVMVVQTHLVIADDPVAATSCWQNGGAYGVQP